MPFPSIHPALAAALAARGYDEPTPVQDAVLQAAEDRDLLVSAQTGSGKTVAYGLAVAPTLLGTETHFGLAAAPLALVIAPTRELAMQVHRELAWLYESAGARIASCIGGTDGQAEGRALAAGCHIVVGTPGRLCDHLDRGRLDLSGLRAVVLDEADEMLDLGFRDELEKLLSATPERRRMLLFSATIARDIVALARRYQHEALRIDTLVRNQPHADIEYRAVRVAGHEARQAVVNVLRSFDAPTALVFCATRAGVQHLQATLLARGFSSVALSGELSQNERTRALQALRDGQARVCVATDVAARGLDLPDLGLVVHADMPTNPATLLHRSGRTGRAGRKGICVVIVPASKARRAEQLLSSAGVAAQWAGPPSAAEIRALDSERLLAEPLLTEPPTVEDAALAQRLLDGRPAIDIAAALIRLYRAGRPAPEELSEPYTPPDRRARATREPRDRPDRDRHRDEAPRERGAGMVWFSMNVGRANKADPKWLLPLICRLGGVTKRDVGSIKIADLESRFEIREDIASRFQASLPPDGQEEVTIRPAAGPGAPSAPPPYRRFAKTAPASSRKRGPKATRTG